MKTEEQTKKVAEAEVSEPVKSAKEETVCARDRIKPRGLAGLFKGEFHYDKDADIFNLGL
ncbi:hypothetical protein Barb6_00665 [Bacteroidales bacterium Barb6]|nr:hypothetical protein Barb6XT_00743 [Bacteroidales bacterium Barb6XT]OAV72976.1 hypothetical protein Barb6_00665 [Bacteroidales bacterium Barb6]